VASYNNSVHSTQGIQPCKVNPSRIYSIWKRINSLGAKIPVGRVKFRVGDFVRITKEKVKFAKGYEQNFSTEIFQVVKVIQRMPQPVYELSDLQNRPIEGLFYNYELVKFVVSPKQNLKWIKYCTHVTKTALNSFLSSGKDTIKLLTLG